MLNVAILIDSVMLAACSGCCLTEQLVICFLIALDADVRFCQDPNDAFQVLMLSHQQKQRACCLFDDRELNLSAEIGAAEDFGNQLHDAWQ